LKTRVCRLHGQGDLRIEDQHVVDLGQSDVLVSVARGGICGSDLHYYQDGGIGQIRVTEPLILGHELAGRILRTGVDVKGLQAGDKVAVNPSHPCKTCAYCKEGLLHHCMNMKFLGSAKSIPHVQGGFREKIVVKDKQCFRIQEAVDFGEAACAEPLAVCLHARNQAERIGGKLAGKRILVTGSGPIGVLCAAVCAHADASSIIVTDLHDFTLDIASRMGADRTVNVLTRENWLESEIEQAGLFDVVFECSAAEAAVKTAVKALRPQGILVQVGVAGNLKLPIDVVVGKEITLCGSHRFHPEFAEAARIINNREIDVKPIITRTKSIDEAEKAFALAADRSKAMKVQLRFD